MKLQYEPIEELVRATTNEVFVEEELGLKQYFAPFHRKKGDGFDYLTTRDAHKMLRVFYEGVITNNQKTYDAMISNTEIGFPENVIRGFIRHKTESQIKDLLYRH